MSYFVILAAFLTSCSSQPPRPAQPAWITNTTRSFDNGYLVYVGQGDDANADRARFNAEGAALLDLANECSFAPKGARVEDRYETAEKGNTRAYTKVGVTFEECEAAKSAVAPEEVRRLANPQIAQTIAKYQELIGGPMPSAVSVVASDVPLDDTTYYRARQDVFLAKQLVILAPVTSYTASAPETVRYYTETAPTVVRVQQYEVAHPFLRGAAHGWSHHVRLPSAHAPSQKTPRTFSPRQPPARHARPVRRHHRRR